MAFMGRTRAVADKLVKDIDKSIFWTTLVIQIFFFFFYGYSIYTNLNNTVFLVIYILLALLALFNFIYMIATHPYKKESGVKKVKLFARVFKYFINASMIGVNIFEMVKLGGTDFNKIMIIVSGVSLGVQIILEFVRAFMAYYTDLFMTSIQMDLSFFIKLSKAKETKGNFYEFIDMPLEAIANKLEGKEPELTDKEKKLNEMAKEYEQLNKQKVKENSEKNAEEQKEQIKNHWNIIKNKVFNRKKN